MSALIDQTVDPYGYFGAPRIEGFNALKPAAATRVRAVKPHAVIRVQPRTIIVGNSRPEMGIDPQSPNWPEIMRPVYNLSIPGDSLTAQAEQATRALAATHTSTLIWAVDFLDFIWESGRPSAAEPSTGAEHIVDLRNGALALLSTQALVDSFWTVLNQANSNSETRTELGFNPANDYRQIIASQGAYILFEQKRHYLDDMLGQSKWTVFDDAAASYKTSREFRAFKEVLRFCSARGIQVVVLINPYHAEYMRIIRNRGYGNMFDMWKDALTGTVSEFPRVTLWDFSAPHPYLDEPLPDERSRQPLQWFWEPSHYRRELGEIMLARMLNKTKQAESAAFGHRVIN